MNYGIWEQTYLQTFPDLLFIPCLRLHNPNKCPVPSWHNHTYVDMDMNNPPFTDDVLLEFGFAIALENDIGE